HDPIGPAAHEPFAPSEDELALLSAACYGAVQQPRQRASATVIARRSSSAVLACSDESNAWSGPVGEFRILSAGQTTTASQSRPHHRAHPEGGRLALKPVPTNQLT